LDSEAIGYFKRAVEEDPHFALAYAKLAASYDNLDESDEAEKYAQKAFDLRGNTTESERFYITAYYHDLVTGDVPAEIETYEAWKVAYPRAWMPRWFLAEAYITYIGDFEKAVEEARAAVRLNPKDPDMYLRLAIALSGVGRLRLPRGISGGPPLADRRSGKPRHSPTLLHTHLNALVAS